MEENEVYHSDTSDEKNSENIRKERWKLRTNCGKKKTPLTPQLQNEAWNWKCHICGMGFQVEINFLFHVKLHQEAVSFIVTDQSVKLSWRRRNSACMKSHQNVKKKKEKISSKFHRNSYFGRHKKLQESCQNLTKRKINNIGIKKIKSKSALKTRGPRAVVKTEKACKKKSFSEKKGFECTFCYTKLFTTSRSLKRHIQTFHKPLLQDPCQTLSKIKKSFKCSFCLKLLSGRDNLRRHIQLVHESQSENISQLQDPCLTLSKIKKSFKCTFCLKLLSGRDNLRRHIQLVHESELQDRRQTFCKRKINNIETASKKSKSTFKCRKVLAKIKAEKACKKKTVSGKNAFKCTFCTKLFSANPSLKRHIQTVHEGLRPFSCYFCGQKFGQKSILYSHMNYLHLLRDRKELGVYKCELCSQTLITKFVLKRHIRIVHEALRSFSCYFCGQKFGQKGQLYAHMRLRHFYIKRNT